MSDDADRGESKLSDYCSFNIPEHKTYVLTLLDDNLNYMLEYIYSSERSDQIPYNLPEFRVALALQMLLASNRLISYQLASQIAKDIETLRHNQDYLNRWENSSVRKRMLLKELKTLKAHTEIDDEISLNSVTNDISDENQPDFSNFDLHSGVSTLNVSVHCPDIEGQQEECTIL